MIRVVLPFHLRKLAGSEREIRLQVDHPVTMRAVLNVLEAEYPTLRGTVRDPGTQERRAFLRFFACQQDLSHDSLDSPLPEDVVTGDEPLRIVGAMAGG
jgi:molybdopterin synthase sulfur carrier subunit